MSDWRDWELLDQSTRRRQGVAYALLIAACIAMIAAAVTVILR